MSMAYVITTIQEPTPGVTAIAQEASLGEAQVVVVGDRKSPETWSLSEVNYLSLADQGALPFSLSQVLPENSYTRKMLGYLAAAQVGADWIRETDDDNSPYASFFELVPSSVLCRVPADQSGWVNIYAHFTSRHVWPRGFPLSLVNAGTSWAPETSRQTVNGPFILQAVADGDPDVDAIYRLTAADTSDIKFDAAEPLVLPEGSWTPFNSQATTWPRDLFPLMYLPVTCSFRMTDIWRSFVAQRLLPGLGASLVVTAATVHQDRNVHKFLADIAQ